MAYAIMFVMGLIAGTVCVLLLVMEREKRVNQQRAKQDAQEKTIRETLQKLKAKRQELDQQLKAKWQELYQQSAMLKDRNTSLTCSVRAKKQFEIPRITTCALARRAVCKGHGLCNRQGCGG